MWQPIISKTELKGESFNNENQEICVYLGQKAIDTLHEIIKCLNKGIGFCKSNYSFNIL